MHTESTVGPAIWKALAVIVIVAGVAAVWWVVQHRDRRDYPATVRTNFISACTASSTADYCSCALEAIENKYTLGEYIVWESVALRGGQLPPDMIATVQNKC